MPDRSVFVALLMVGLVASVLPAVAQDVQEYDLKAEFMRRFTLFIEWPAGALPPPDEPFVIGIIGDSPLHGALETRLNNAVIKNRRAELRIVGDLTEIDNCQVLFIASTMQARLDQILVRTRGRPVLTVADCEGCAAHGVLVNFFLVGNQVRFEVNEAAVRDSGLDFSSRLLKVARLVEDGER